MNRINLLNVFFTLSCLFYAALCLVNVPLWYKFYLCVHTTLVLSFICRRWVKGKRLFLI